jgi:hypothetical protein
LALAHASRRLASQLGFPQIRSRPEGDLAQGGSAGTAAVAGKPKPGPGTCQAAHRRHEPGLAHVVERHGPPEGRDGSHDHEP